MNVTVMMGLALRAVLLICLEKTAPLAAVLGVRGAPASTKMASVTRDVMLAGMDCSVKTLAAQNALAPSVNRCLGFVPTDAWKDGQVTSVMKNAYLAVLDLTVIRSVECVRTMRLVTIVMGHVPRGVLRGGQAQHVKWLLEAPKAWRIRMLIPWPLQEV